MTLPPIIRRKDETMPDEKCPECSADTKPWRFVIEGWSSRTGVECTRCKWFRDAEPFETIRNED